MSAPRKTRGGRALRRLLPAALALSACDGYAELPLSIREVGALQIVSVERFATGPGRVEIALAPPNDARGPFTIVGHPSALSANARVLSWALGRCSGEVAGPLTLCLAVATTGPDPLALALVVESRADGRRFTLLGEEAQP